MVPRSLVRLLVALDYIFFACEIAFFYLGLLRQRPLNPWEETVFYVDSSVPVNNVSPATPTPSMVKTRLPVLQYMRLLETFHDDAGGSTCAVCLTELKPRDEVRKLGNCRHALHKRCIDQWIDAGQITCPLCRSQLLPSPASQNEKGAIHGLVGKLSSYRWWKYWSLTNI